MDDEDVIDSYIQRELCKQEGGIQRLIIKKSSDAEETKGEYDRKIQARTSFHSRIS